MTQTQVSVYILTCNQQRYIRKCIQSVLDQSADVALEVLVGDDCSDDDTSSIVAEMAARYHGIIRHFRHASRLGAIENCQVLLRHAKGEFLAHLDGDDYWLPGKLKLQLAFMMANPECAAVYTNALTVNEDGSPMGLFNDQGDGRYDLAAMLRRGNFLNTSSMLFRSALRRSLLEIDTPFIDYRMHLRLARSGFLAQLDQSMVGYRVNSLGSMVSSSNDLVRQLYWEAILDVPRECVTTQDLACGMADFLRRVVFRAVRTRRWSLVCEWAPRVFEMSPVSRIRTAALTFLAIARAIRVESVGRLGKGAVGFRTKVLYRR